MRFDAIAVKDVQAGIQMSPGIALLETEQARPLQDADMQFRATLVERLLSFLQVALFVG